MTITEGARAWIEDARQRVETACTRALPDPTHDPAELHAAMRYAVLGGGKRVRALLAYAAGELGDAPPQALDQVAVALEAMHGYSLIHDDLPCMDNDVLRRGRPTCHVAFGEATALLAGDALQSLAFECLAMPNLLADPARQLEMIALFAGAVGSRGMAGGQAADLRNSGKMLDSVELEFMHIRKTGALIRAAVMLGVLCGERLEPAAHEALEHYSKCVGLLFQLTDDVLDAESDTTTLGKTAGKDALQQKPTYVSVLGLAAARDLARELHANALASLAGFDERATPLRQMADFVAGRSS